MDVWCRGTREAWRGVRRELLSDLDRVDRGENVPNTLADLPRVWSIIEAVGRIEIRSLNCKRDHMSQAYPSLSEGQTVHEILTRFGGFEAQHPTRKAACYLVKINLPARVRRRR